MSPISGLVVCAGDEALHNDGASLVGRGPDDGGPSADEEPGDDADVSPSTAVEEPGNDDDVSPSTAGEMLRVDNHLLG